MADPIEFRIIQNLQTALLAISLVGGYHHDVGALMVKLDPDHDVEALIPPNAPRPFLILAPLAETWTYYPSSEVHLAWPVVVHWIGEATAAQDDSSRLAAFFKACADVEQAISVDITRGGLAYDTRIVRRELDLAVAGTQIWAEIELAITLRRTYGQPNG